MMNFIIENWFILVALICVGVVAFIYVYKFLGLPTKSQVAKIKEWLLLAVIEAESQLGGNTGAVKLRVCYDAFITKFPVTAKLVSFETFSKWVDSALEVMEDLLKENEDILSIVAPLDLLEVDLK